MQQEISRPSSDRRLDDLLARARKWFWSRKPDAGFLIAGFPATLLQAKVFDEWLESRGETLSGCIAPASIEADPVVTHYRTQGVPIFIGAPSAAAA